MKKAKKHSQTGGKKANAVKNTDRAETKSAKKSTPTKEAEPTYRLPTMIELAQIAAALAGKKDLRQFEPDHHTEGSILSVTDAALGLWQNCGQTLRAAMEFNATLDEMLAAPDEAIQIPEWVDALGSESFPIGFKRGLAIIFGPQSRTADRYKGLRDFLKVLYRNICMDDSLGDAEAQNKFTKLKASGFSKMEFEEYARGIHEMKHGQSKEKAKKAAKVRWDKVKAEKKSKNMLGAS